MRTIRKCASPLIVFAAYNLLSLSGVKTSEANTLANNGGFDMTDARAIVVPFRRPTRRRRIDLALALAVLARAVRSHDGVRPPHRYEHAKPLGA